MHQINHQPHDRPRKLELIARGTKKHATRVTGYHLYSATGLIQMLISVFRLISDAQPLVY